jgi:hypothetical protein
VYALVLAPCRRIFEAFENARCAKPPVPTGSRELRQEIRDRGTRSLPLIDDEHEEEDDFRKRGGSTPEMGITSTTVQQANVYRVIVHVLRKNVLYNGYNIPKTEMVEYWNDGPGKS